jgi:hypothetical protein
MGPASSPPRRSRPWAAHGADAREAQSAANRPTFLGALGLANGMAHQPSPASGTVMRPATLRGYAVWAGFGGIEVRDVADDFCRFYRLA